MAEPQRHRNDDTSAGEGTLGPASDPRQDRYRQAAALLRQWMAEEDGYDDAIWPLVAEELEGVRMRCGNEP